MQRISDFSTKIFLAHERSFWSWYYVYDDRRGKRCLNHYRILIKEGNKWANRVESLERQAENAERVVDESEEAHEARYAVICKRGVSKQLADK